MWLLFCCFGPLGFPCSKVIVLSDLRSSNLKHQLKRRGKSSPFAAYIFGQDPKLNLYFFQQPTSEINSSQKKHVFLFTAHLELIKMFAKTHHVPGGRRLERGRKAGSCIPCCTGVLKITAVEKNVTTSPMDELSDLCCVLLLQDSVCVSHPTPHESHHEKKGKKR